MMAKPVALIIDDEPDIRELLQITLARMGLDCLCTENLASAKAALKDNSFDLCLTDMKLPDGNGVEFVAYVQRNYPGIPIAVITAHGNMEIAIQALKSGAFDFLNKPVDLSQLRALIDSALKLTNLDEKHEKKLVGDSEVVNNIRQMISKLARSQAPVYISGESGVGKELVARMIHEQSPRAGKAFVPVNCGAIPTELMESELFGYVKGSFTGADADKKGLFHAAEGGTLFLDEVAELPEHMQVKLLRVIQEKKIRQVGAEQELPVNVRLLSATHKDLNQLVEAGKFRKDLYYRINVIELHVPPLRKRKEDLPLIIEYILERIKKEYNLNASPVLTETAYQSLLKYDFPGNVRELENILERAMTLSDGQKVTQEDLQLPDMHKSGGLEAASGNDDRKLDSYLDDVERQMIVDALEESRWNKTKAAKKLGLTLRALRYRLEKLGLD